MLKNIVLGGIGAALGAALGAGAVYIAWHQDQMESAESYRRLSDEYNNLVSHPPKPKPADDRYDLDAIRHCMLDSNLRSSAVLAFTTGRPMADIERGAFQPLLAVDQQNKDKSMQARSSAVMEESIKLDRECLDRSHIKS